MKFEKFGHAKESEKYGVFITANKEPQAAIFARKIAFPAAVSYDFRNS
jgi:hypothetical protein